MGSKKKSKSNKFARMSEEERLRYLQHRAAMEEEAQKRKQELVSTYLKIKLRHEEAFTRLNSAKINQQWRYILRQIKCKELKEDVETLKQRYEVVMECKNKVIENLLQDFDRAEFQYSLQFKSHMETISKFLDIHRTRMADLHNWYSEQLHDMLEKAKKNRRKFLSETEKDTTLTLSKKNTEADHAQRNLYKMKENFDERKNELQTKLLYKMTKLEEKYADELNDLKQKYDAILNQYKKNTDTKHAHYKILAEKDDFDSLQIIRHFEEIACYMQRIQEMKVELQDLETKNEREIESFELQKSNINEELQKCQKVNNVNMIKDQAKLRVLVNISNTVIKDLSGLTAFGQKLVDLGESCEKMRTKTENSLPQLTIPKKQEAEQSPSSFDKLEQFWKNYNKTKIANEILRQKKRYAIAENKKLRKLLRIYVVSIRRSSSVPRKCGF